MGITKKLAIDLSSIQVLSDQDTEQLHTLIIDFFAAAFAGYQQNRAFNQAVEEVVLKQGGTGESYVLFQNKRFPAGKAAFMNSLYGHGAELDDGNKTAAGHCGVHVIPAVFALADQLHSTQSDVLLAIATGYEAYIRISSAAQPGMVQRGFHSTGMAGTLACAAACARLYHLDAQGIEDAIALSTTLTGGLLSYGDSRPAIKPLNPGKAAENGVFAAMLAKEGVRGPSQALEGPNGWFHAVTDQYDESMLQGGDHLLLHDCYFKQYPSCRHTHCGLDAAIALHSRVDPRQIRKIRVYIYPNAIKLAGQIRFPKDSNETKFSIHYTLASALLKGTYGIADMEPANMPEEVIDLIQRIELIPDPSMEDRNRNIRGTRVELIKMDGEVLEEIVLTPKGDPENPLTREDIIRKLETCADEILSSKSLEALVSSIDKISLESTFLNPLKAISADV